MRLQTTGMEFASEMVIHAAKAGLRVEEVPVTYFPRAEGSEAKLRSFRDGWRHLRFMLLYSPDWLFVIPGAALSVLGFILMFALIGGPIDIAGLHFDVHYMVLGSMFVLVGLQVISLGLYAKVFSISEHFEERSRLVSGLTRHFNLERGIVVGSLIFLAGVGLNLNILITWLNLGFGGQPRIREAILGMTLVVVGLQIVFSSFFLSLLVIKRK
jgi:hypothetical protein